MKKYFYYLPLHVFLLFSYPALADNSAKLDNRGVWTEEQVEKFCFFRAEKNRGNQRIFDSCMKRNSGKIGKNKQPGIITELNQADSYLAKKSKNEEKNTGRNTGRDIGRDIEKDTEINKDNK